MSQCESECEPSCAVGAILAGSVDGTVVQSADGWAVFVLHRLAYPGWLILAPHRHVTGFGELADAEAARFAALLARVDRAVRTALAPAKVYFFALGDAMPHWHLLVAPVSPDVAATGLRGAQVLTGYPAVTDVAAATRTARAILTGARPVPPA